MIKREWKVWNHHEQTWYTPSFIPFRFVQTPVHPVNLLFGCWNYFCAMQSPKQRWLFWTSSTSAWIDFLRLSCPTNVHTRLHGIYASAAAAGEHQSFPSISSEIHLVRVPLRFRACKLDETVQLISQPLIYTRVHCGAIGWPWNFAS